MPRNLHLAQQQAPLSFLAFPEGVAPASMVSTLGTQAAVFIQVTLCPSFLPGAFSTMARKPCAQWKVSYVGVLPLGCCRNFDV